MIRPQPFALLSIPLALLSCTGHEPADTTPPVELVNPFIGSGGKLAGVGSTSVTASLPFGMAKPGPDTTPAKSYLYTDHFSGYYYFDEYINGFSQVHIHGTGAADYGALALMPTRGFDATKTSEEGYRARFDKATEAAAPGYYAVTLEKHEIKVELTATTHAAVHRYTFNAPDKTDHVIVDLAHALWNCEVTSARLWVGSDRAEIVGWLVYKGALTGRYGGVKLHFVARFDQALKDWTLWQGGKLLPRASSVQGSKVGAAVRVSTSASKPVEVAIGLSYVDLAGARANLERELGGRDFDTLRAAAREAWSKALSRIRVEGGTRDERISFYSALYHAMLNPVTFTDVDGRYPGLDGQAHRAEGFTFYSDITLWDTYRTVHPLWILIEPELQRDVVVSFLKMYDQGGRLPKCPVGPGYGGCMISTPADTIIAGTYLKGITAFDVTKAYKAIKHNATTTLTAGGGRAAVEDYVKLGYVPADSVSGATARTLENGIADAAIAALARKLGHLEDAKQFDKQAASYKNLWDPATGFLRARKKDGSWKVPQDEFRSLTLEGGGEYTEGTAWQYLWLVPHDPLGLAQLMGGKATMVKRLETFFATPEPNPLITKLGWSSYYWHGNEPDIHAAYLFAAVGEPARTQHWVRQTMKEAYNADVDGLAGNDDCGTLSSWYIFSAAGFYPIAGQDHYIIGSPVFTRVTFDLGGGKTFEVRARDTSAENLYVQAARLNGATLEAARFSHAKIRGGGVLELELGPQPSSWGRTK